MLRFLRIRNLAVIEAVEVEFEPGFNVLTGETGAGKSIVVEAVGLLLGGRSSADLVRTGETQAVIEAIFERDADEVVVRRELTSQGRSRSFVNGELATASALRELSKSLAELHGQHEHQGLLDAHTHLAILDEYAGLTTTAEQVRMAWTDLRTIRERVDRSTMDARERSARLEFVTFQLGEIERVAPRAGEDEELAATRQVLLSAERVQVLCEESYAALYERDDAVLAALGGVWKRVEELAAIDRRFLEFVEAREGIKSQLEDLALSLRHCSDGIDASPGRLEEVESRLASLERLKRKHGPTLAEVLARQQALRFERDLLVDSDESGEDLLARLKATEERYLDVALELSRQRREAATSFAEEIERLLAELAMDRTVFEVRFADVTREPLGWSEHGVDQAEFYVSPNIGEEPRPLARTASGGELSRVMLALKTLTVGDTAGKTLVFDEVDSGIGGRVAEVVGSRLRALGDRFQVLCITHLPQIAAQGSTHFRIEKHVRNGRTHTGVTRLSDELRVEEVGRMIGGRSVTDVVRATAVDLLNTARGAKAKGERRKS